MRLRGGLSSLSSDQKISQLVEIVQVRQNHTDKRYQSSILYEISM
jgi:hypothetical protein